MAANDTVDAALREASNELIQPGGSLQTVDWEKFQTSDDSMVYYQVSYNNMSSLRFRHSKRANRIQPQDVGFRKGDRDWHKPLLVTFRAASGETRGDTPDASTETGYTACRTGYRRRSRPYLRPVLPVGPQLRLSTLCTGPASSTAHSRGRFSEGERRAFF